jgi:hypothetical protein
VVIARGRMEVRLAFGACSCMESFIKGTVDLFMGFWQGIEELLHLNRVKNDPKTGRSTKT